MHSVETVLQALNFYLLLGIWGTILTTLGSGSEPSLPLSRTFTRVNYSHFTVYCFGILRILCFMIFYPIVSTKYSSVPQASGENKKAVTLEMKLKKLSNCRLAS